MAMRELSARGHGYGSTGVVQLYRRGETIGVSVESRAALHSDPAAAYGWKKYPGYGFRVVAVAQQKRK